jgi:hypothetical protein
MVHFHGAKPQTGVWKIAECEFNLKPDMPSAYRAVIWDGIGETEAAVKSLNDRIEPPSNEVLLRCVEYRIVRKHQKAKKWMKPYECRGSYR